ncbi:MAG: hypothetical protein ACYC2H_00995 [Thermoplasmatota archaeon]
MTGEVVAAERRKEALTIWWCSVVIATVPVSILTLLLGREHFAFSTLEVASIVVYLGVILGAEAIALVSRLRTKFEPGRAIVWAFLSLVAFVIVMVVRAETGHEPATMEWWMAASLVLVALVAPAFSMFEHFRVFLKLRVEQEDAEAAWKESQRPPQGDAPPGRFAAGSTGRIDVSAEPGVGG